MEPMTNNQKTRIIFPRKNGSSLRGVCALAIVGSQGFNYAGPRAKKIQVLTEETTMNSTAGYVTPTLALRILYEFCQTEQPNVGYILDLPTATIVRPYLH